MVSRRLTLAALLCAGTVASVLMPELGCGAGDCRSGEDDCLVAPPCARLRFECQTEGFVRVRRLEAGDDRPGGLDALGTPGDLLLENDRVQAVVDAIDHPHFVAASGGALLDLATQGGDDDSLNHVFQATGLLPHDAARYVSMETLEEDGVAAVVFRGHLDGDEDQKIATRYEVRPCEPGVRVRTEFVNLSPDDAIVTLTDGWYWSDREAIPFTPLPGIGFEHEDFGLLTIQEVYYQVPLMAASGHTEPSAAYSVVACSDPFLEGFQSVQVSAAGTERRIVPPRGSQVFERFVSVTPGRSIQPAVDVALEVRRQLFGEPLVPISGRVVTSSGALGTGEVRASVLISEGKEGTPRAERTPWTQTLPDADGRFSAKVPAGRSYLVEVTAFGRVVATREVDAEQQPVDAGDLEIPPAGALLIDVTVDGASREAQVFLHPADEETRADVEARLLGNFEACAPLLGPPDGASPACNRLLALGPTRVETPPGRYDVYATAGPFVSLAMETVEVEPGETTGVTLALVTLPLQPAGTLSADFHVHGAASFDSSIPDLDRVRAFLAASMQVIVATDHDVIHDYRAARDTLLADDRLVVITGLETTGHVLFDLVPDSSIPLVIGHYNFWPLEKEPDAPRRGAPYDERLEPGALFTRMEEAGLPEAGVRQLNHPWADADFGRDLGFPRAIGVDVNEPLPRERDDSGPSLFLATPEGSRYSNADYHVQEVMNGTNNEAFAAYRAFWFYLLDQGVVRGGTANSDSHGLSDNVLGTPRTLVYADTTTAAFDVDLFDRAVKAGRMIGTNGPVIEVTTTGEDGGLRRPSTEAFTPAPDAVLSIRVTAAPWVPVEEVRIVVNGRVVRTLAEELASPVDPFGANGLLRYDGEIELSGLLPPEGDAWLVVEAGAPLLPNGDLNCDGVPDTGDNDGNGTIDWRDAEDNEEEPDECDGEIGPLAHPAKPPRGDPRRHFEAVTPDGYPLAFTNPLLLDRDGGGFSGIRR